MDEDGETVLGEFMHYRKSFECTYPWGFDPVWGLASNNLTFANNIKMKLSVIFGVLHMSMGIYSKATNAIHFR